MRVRKNIEDTTPRLFIEFETKNVKPIHGNIVWYAVYECMFCGRLFIEIRHKVNTGVTKSCRCQKEHKGNPIHGHYRHRLFPIWRAMVQRCTNPNDKGYSNYGGRGITVCDEWLDFNVFNTWAGLSFVEGTSLDRIDNNKGYSPENCRWTDRTTQSVNQRARKDNTSGYVGINWNSKGQTWIVRIQLGKERVNIGRFKILEDAVNARDSYILLNNLPHKLSIDYETSYEEITL